MPNPKQYLQKEIIPGNNLSWDTDGVTLNANIEANPQETPTDTLESLEIDGTVYDLGGGTEVEANPSDPATDTLSSIDIDGTVYDLGGGTEVEANPSDPATDTLSSIDIDGTVYSIEGSGGGGISYDYYLQDGNIGGGPGSTAYATVPLDKTLTEGTYIAYTVDSNGTTGNTFFTWGGTNKSLTTGSITYTLSATAATATDYSGNWRDIFLTIFKLNSGGGTGGGGFSAPDYENPETITLVLNTWVTYNVTENGYIMIDLTAYTETGGTSVKVNGTVLSFDMVVGNNYILNATYMFPVMKDDVVEIRLNYNSAGYGGNTALFFPAKNGGGGGGSEVIPNPQGEPTDTLNTIEIDGVIYDIPGSGGGTGNLNAVEMEYNDWLALPQEEREDPTIEYFLSNAPGGGGSGGGGNFTQDEIWTGPSTPTTSGTNITLDKDWQEYDFLVFELAQSTNYYSTPMIYTKDMAMNKKYISAGYGYERFDACFTPLSATSMKIERISSSGVETTYQKIYGIKFGEGGGDLSAYELTQNQYNNLPTTQKLDEKELYFINNNITTEEAIDVTDFVNKVESGGAMTITADATNNTLTYVWGGASTIGANSFYPTVISSNVSRIDYKITTGTSYTTSDNQFKIGIGVKSTYDATNWAKSSDNNWVAIDVYNTQNTIIEGSLDLSEVDTDTYLYICGHGWNMTIEDLTIVTVNESTDPTKIMYKDVEYGNGGGSGGGNLYGTTDPASDLGNNGDIYMKYQGGSEPVESDYKTAWSGSISCSTWASPVTVPDVNPSLYHKLRFTGTYANAVEFLVDDIAIYPNWTQLSSNINYMWIQVSDDGTELKMTSGTGYRSTLTLVEGTKMEYQPPQILNVFGKVEDEWVGFPGYSEKVLWSGSESISQNASPFSVPNSSYDDISEYDEIQIEYENGNNATAKRYSVPVEMFKTYPNEAVNPEARDALSVQRTCYPKYDTTDNCIKIYCESNYPIYIKKIIGVKRGESSANSSASLYKWFTSNDGTITVRTGPDGVYWFFNGFNTDGGGSTFVNIPSELAQFAPTNTDPQLSEAYSDPSGSTVGWIGFYQGTIRGWNPTKFANLFTTLYGVVKADGASEQHNGYFSAYKGIPNSGGISYSTAEQVVGTWVDGKPIYQRSYVLQSAINLSTTAYTGFTPDNIGKMDMMIDAMGHRPSSAQHGSACDKIFARKQDNTLYLYDAVGFANVSTITLQYTKTTD